MGVKPTILWLWFYPRKEYVVTVRVQPGCMYPRTVNTPLTLVSLKQPIRRAATEKELSTKAEERDFNHNVLFLEDIKLMPR